MIQGEILEFDSSFAVAPISAVSQYVEARDPASARKNRRGAVQHAKQAVTLDPDSLGAHETLSDAYAANHQMDAAMPPNMTQLCASSHEAIDPEFQADLGAPQKPTEPK